LEFFMSRVTVVFVVSVVSVFSTACTPIVGGPVVGEADTHCGSTFVTTNSADCHATATEDGGTPEVPEVRYNSAADDDDCKYHVVSSASPITQNADVSFSVTVTKKSDGSKATGANAGLEAFLSSTHPAPNSGVKTTENSPGVYTIGPVRFDAPGRWTVKYHLYESCTDFVETSPHGHVSFFVDVP
jgi:hypothetical protein